MSMSNSWKHHRHHIHFVLWCDGGDVFQDCIVFVLPHTIISLRCNPNSYQLGPNFNKTLTWINCGWIAETYANTALWNSQGAQINVCFGTALPRDLNWEIAASIDRARVSTIVLASEGTKGLSTHKWRATLWILRHPQNPNSSISSAGVLWRWKCSVKEMPLLKARSQTPWIFMRGRSKGASAFVTRAWRALGRLHLLWSIPSWEWQSSFLGRQQTSWHLLEQLEICCGQDSMWMQRAFPSWTNGDCALPPGSHAVNFH